MSISDPAMVMTDDLQPTSPDQPVAARAEKPPTDWWGEVKAIFWLILAVLAFHSFIAKPFYIPSESMMPLLLKGDRLVVSKYPYGWSWVSPSFHVWPEMGGKLFGRTPKRGDVVILTPKGEKTDYIKRVIGLPGDTIEMRRGELFINGQAVKREARPPVLIPIDVNVPCNVGYPVERVAGGDGAGYCKMPVVRETLPEGRSYDTIDLGYIGGPDDYGPYVVPEGHVFVMGDNRDQSADSRVAGGRAQGLDGAIPLENVGGRAEFITFSYDGSTQWLNPISWFSALRGGRAGTSLHPAREPSPPARSE